MTCGAERERERERENREREREGEREMMTKNVIRFGCLLSGRGPLGRL